MNFFGVWQGSFCPDVKTDRRFRCCLCTEIAVGSWDILPSLCWRNECNHARYRAESEAVPGRFREKGEAMSKNRPNIMLEPKSMSTLKGPTLPKMM